MFVLSQSQSYLWPVTVELPVSGGKYEKHTFDAEFKRLPQSRIVEVWRLIDKQEISAIEFCKEILVGWKGVTNDKNEEIPFSEGSRDGLLDVPMVAGAIVNAFSKSLEGSKAKN